MPLSLFSAISHLHPHFSSNPRTPSSLLFTHAALHRFLLRQQWFPFFPFPRIRSGFPSLSLLLRRRRWLRNSRPVAFSWDRTKATSSPGRNLLPDPQVAKGMALSGVHTDRGELRIHESLDELGIDLADYISELSEASVKERGVFAIALSGGSLIGLMRKLCEAPYIKTVDWSKWYIFWVDERVVAKNHAESNYKMARDLLLTKVPIVHSHVHSINDFVSAEEASDEYEFAIVVIGDSKAEAVHLVIDDVGPDCPSVPARMIQPTEGKLVWFLDKPSASRLDGSKFSKQGPA